MRLFSISTFSLLAQTQATDVNLVSSNILPGASQILALFNPEQSSNIITHGCWCQQLDETNENITGGNAYDDLDRICKDWKSKRVCNSESTGTCSNGPSSDYYSISYSSSEVYSCSDDDICLRDTCRVDSFYSQQIVELLSGQTSWLPNSSVDCDPSGSSNGNGSSSNGSNDNDSSGSSNSGETGQDNSSTSNDQSTSNTDSCTTISPDLSEDYESCAYPAINGTINQLYQDVFKFWKGYRDPRNGLYCDNQDFQTTTVCGETNYFYSSASLGMGLVAEAIFSELGLQDFNSGLTNAEETITTFINSWPKEETFGYYQHFTDDEFRILAEYSTIDTAIAVCGAAFAGNYFGGNVKNLADQLLDQVDWSAAIPYADWSEIYMIVDTAQDPPIMSSPVRSYNEYYIVAYLAKITDPDNSVVQTFFETFFGTTGKPVGGQDGRPYTVSYNGFEALSDIDQHWVSSFVALSPRFLTKGFNQNPYYKTEMLPNWLNADKSFWRNSVEANITPFEVWGQNVENKVFGCGAGDSPNGGYTIQEINDVAPDYTFSIPIMAGFLGLNDDCLNREVKYNLDWLYENGVCSYTKNYVDGTAANVLWRCSVSDSQWTADRPTSVDFTFMVMGYAIEYLGDDFYENYAI